MAEPGVPKNYVDGFVVVGVVWLPAFGHDEAIGGTGTEPVGRFSCWWLKVNAVTGNPGEHSTAYQDAIADAVEVGVPQRDAGGSYHAGGFVAGIGAVADSLFNIAAPPGIECAVGEIWRPTGRPHRFCHRGELQKKLNGTQSTPNDLSLIHI